jgi:transposase-like protein
MDKKERREVIVAEYLAGGVSLRELGRKHGLNFRQVHRVGKGI